MRDRTFFAGNGFLLSVKLVVCCRRTARLMVGTLAAWLPRSSIDGPRSVARRYGTTRATSSGGSTTARRSFGPTSPSSRGRSSSASCSSRPTRSTSTHETQGQRAQGRRRAAGPPLLAACCRCLLLSTDFFSLFIEIAQGLICLEEVQSPGPRHGKAVAGCGPRLEVRQGRRRAESAQGLRHIQRCRA